MAIFTAWAKIYCVNLTPANNIISQYAVDKKRYEYLYDIPLASKYAPEGSCLPVSRWVIIMLWVPMIELRTVFWPAHITLKGWWLKD